MKIPFRTPLSLELFVTIRRGEVKKPLRMLSDPLSSVYFNHLTKII